MCLCRLLSRNLDTYSNRTCAGSSVEDHVVLFCLCFVIVSALKMIIVAIGAVELPMTNVTGLVGHGMVSRTASLFGCVKVGAIITLTRTTPFPLARMMFDVIVIVPFIAVITEIRE